MLHEIHGKFLPQKTTPKFRNMIADMYKIIIVFLVLLTWCESKKTSPRSCSYIGIIFKAIMTLTNHP